MIIIGEKLNGFIPLVGDAIRARDTNFIRERTLCQAESGADFLDVCAAMDESEDAEFEALSWLIQTVQSVCNTPLCIDSPNPNILMRALPLCARPGVVNSVSMEKGKADLLFPAIAKTAWKCVALLCDDNGIPTDANRRIEIGKSLLQKAAEFGIDSERLLIDPLVRTLSTDENAFLTFAETCAGIRALDTRVHITSGASNISFGLPERKVINRAFVVLAMHAGMDSAIIDPTDRELKGLIYAATALFGQDEYCMDYITAYRERRFGAHA